VVAQNDAIGFQNGPHEHGIFRIILQVQDVERGISFFTSFFPGMETKKVAPPSTTPCAQAGRRADE